MLKNININRDWADYPECSDSEEENVNNDYPKIIKQKKLLIFQNEKENVKNDKDDMIHQLANTADSLFCENYELSEEIHQKNILIEEMKNMILSSQLENEYLYTQNSNLNVYINHYVNENTQLRNMIQSFVNNNHPDNVYPDKDIDKEECISISSIQSNLINVNEDVVLPYDALSKFDLNKSEIFIDEDKTNYIGDIHPLLQIVFGNELDKVLSSCRGILNTQYDDNNRLFIRQINILTIIMSNGESIVVSASAVSRSFMYVHFKHMIKICEKCTRCWLLTDGKYEYLYSNRQEPIEYDENHTNQTCSGWKQPVKQVDN
jgi:hypothetical protein